jgi:hypothetical protein
MNMSFSSEIALLRPGVVGRALDLESRGLRFDSLWRQAKKTAR